ncbi:MAG: fibrobacter succinogenes major paralogous domain-containing protein, partial [Flavobacteriales bacterium]
ALHAGSVRLHVSPVGDTLFVGDGSFVVIPGLSEANGFTTGTSLHTCGAPNVHNPDLVYGSMTDQEGNFYKTIVIGTQEWMAENLNTSIYRNGDSITTNLNDASWSASTSGAWAYYNNDASNACPYGKLYNWYTCVDARQLCPTGWHVPNNEEWIVLTDYLGGNTLAAGTMKSTGTIDSGTGLWHAPNTQATNSSGFSGIPGGYRGSTGIFNTFSDYGYWWGSSAGGSFFTRARTLYYLNGNVAANDYNKKTGCSVRCVRD